MTNTTTNSGKAWAPDVQGFVAADVLPNLLISEITTVAGAVEGDEVSLRVPTVNDVDTEFVAEGAEFTEQEGALSEVVVNTHKVGALVIVSNELDRNSASDLLPGNWHAPLQQGQRRPTRQRSSASRHAERRRYHGWGSARGQPGRPVSSRVGDCGGRSECRLHLGRTVRYGRPRSLEGRDRLQRAAHGRAGALWASSPRHQRHASRQHPGWVYDCRRQRSRSGARSAQQRLRIQQGCRRDPR